MTTLVFNLIRMPRLLWKRPLNERVPSCKGPSEKGFKGKEMEMNGQSLAEIWKNDIG
jgi:hypothetical protein